MQQPPSPSFPAGAVLHFVKDYLQQRQQHFMEAEGLSQRYAPLLPSELARLDDWLLEYLLAAEEEEQEQEAASTRQYQQLPSLQPSADITDLIEVGAQWADALQYYEQLVSQREQRRQQQACEEDEDEEGEDAEEEEVEEAAWLLQDAEEVG